MGAVSISNDTGESRESDLPRPIDMLDTLEKSSPGAHPKPIFMQNFRTGPDRLSGPGIGSAAAALLILEKPEPSQKREKKRP